jgi:FHS family L-fucose permease-like MFS transporter
MTTSKTVESPKGNGRLIAIIAMFFLFAMISFVTNLAAPIGTIWKNNYEWAGMLGNMMNFLAYLFMGIPAGNLLVKIGYKKTALYAMIVGIVGLIFQLLSSSIGANVEVLTVSGQPVMLNFFIYLLGAFICGFCVCMLNTVVNPMLNLLGGGGNKGNQLIQTGGALNSLSGTLTPLFVGLLIGTVTKATNIGDVTPLLYIAIAVFVVSFIIISFVAIPEPHMQKAGAKKIVYEHSALSFRHCLLGIIAIFFYVGIEVAIPQFMNFYISDTTDKGAGILLNGAAIGGALAACYWLLMLVGRFASSAISAKVSTRAQLITVSTTAIVLVLLAIFTPKSSRFNVPNFIYDPIEKTESILTEAQVPAETITEFIETKDVTLLADYADTLENNFELTPEKMVKSTEIPSVPIKAIFFILCGLCTSVMWGGIFNLAVEGLGKYTAKASGLFMTMVVGGGVMPLIQDFIAGSVGYIASYWLIVAMLAYILYYALVGFKNVNKDIPVDEEVVDAL